MDGFPLIVLDLKEIVANLGHSKRNRAMKPWMDIIRAQLTMLQILVLYSSLHTMVTVLENFILVSLYSTEGKEHTH